MRVASVLVLLLFLGACRTAPPVLAPAARPAVEDVLAGLLATAAAPETDAATFTAQVASRNGASDVTLADVRSLVRDVTDPDGRFVYEVEEYVAEPIDGTTWHVLRVVFARPGADKDVVGAEFGFVAEGSSFRLGLLSR